MFIVHRGNVEGYKDGQQSILHLVTYAEAIANASLNFVFSDGHAAIGYTGFYKACQKGEVQPGGMFTVDMATVMEVTVLKFRYCLWAMRLLIISWLANNPPANI